MPILIQCPNCEKQLRVQDELVGKRVKCPSCGTAFAGTPVQAPPPVPPPTPVAPPAPPQEEVVDYRGNDDEYEHEGDERRRRLKKKKRRAGERVKIPAIFMLILGIFGAIVSVILTVLITAGVALAAPALEAQGPFGNDPRVFNRDPRLNPRGAIPIPPEAGPNSELISNVRTWIAGSGIVGGALSLILHALLIFGSIQMLRLRTYGLAMTAAILCMLLGIFAGTGFGVLGGMVAGPCCCFGIVFLPLNLGIGIWSLVVLLSADVKSAFV